MTERRIAQKPPLPELKAEATINLDQTLLEEAVRQYLRSNGYIAESITLHVNESQRVERFSAKVTIRVEPVRPISTRDVNRNGTSTVSSAVDMREVDVRYHD